MPVDAELYFTPIIIVILILCLLISFVIAVAWGRRNKTYDQFLVALGQMSPMHFALSETGYMIAVGSTVVLLTSLTYIYGSIMVVISIISWVAAIAVFLYLLQNDEIKLFFSKDFHLGRFIVSNNNDSTVYKVFSCAIALIITLQYVGYFIAEIVAIKILMPTIGSSENIYPVLVGCTLIAILYTSIGGYIGTFISDSFQTLLLVIALLGFFVLIMIKGDFGDTGFTVTPIVNLAHAQVSIMSTIVTGLSIVLLGVSYMIVAMDNWVRVRSSSGGIDLNKARKGLKLSLITLIPFIVICLLGVALSASGVIVPDGEEQNVVPYILNAFDNVMPIGLVFVLLIVVALSTADTALITALQSLSPILPAKYQRITVARYVLLAFGIIGLIGAFIFQDVLRVVFIVLAVPVSLAPILLFRLFWRKKIHPKAGLTTFIIAIAISVFMAMSEYGTYAPVVVFILSFITYGSTAVFSKKEEVV